MSMNRSTGAAAYVSALDNTLYGRQLEAHVLRKSADRLQGVIDAWGAEGHEDRLYDAVSRTHRLWSIFQASLADPYHPMDEAVRVNLLSLSVFIDHRLFSALAAPDPEKLAVVIGIHRELAAGLSTRPVG